MDFDLSTYYPVFIYLVVVLALSAVILISTHLIGPRKNTAVKLMPYESGMDPIGDARQRFDVKFYLIAILFLVFDVELLFLYPWAVSTYRDYGGEPLVPAAFRNVIFWEILVFLGTLGVGYVYAWRKGVFQWRR
ncbi:MAG: NADH-quinone oxidoreductase subunit A [Gemmataceae bacterium]